MELKKRIVHESMKLFSLKGFLSTSIHDILHEAKTSKGGLYNHFKSKEELFFSVLSEARKIWREKTLQGLDRIEKPVAKVKKLLHNYFNFYLQDGLNFPGGCIFVSMSVELDDQMPHLAKDLSEGYSRLKKMIKRLLEEGKRSGELRDDVDTEEVTEMIFAGMLGASVIYGTEKSPEGLRRVCDSLIGYLNTLSR